MKRIKLPDGITRCELTEVEIKDLFTKAEDAMQFTFPKQNEGFAVSIITTSGNLYTGVS